VKRFSANQFFQSKGAIASLLLTTCIFLTGSARAISWEPVTPTPGAQIKLEKASDGFYVMRASGFPANKEYVLMMKYLDGKIGTVPIADIQALLGGKYSFVYSNVYRGEPIEYAVISSDGTVRAYTRIIPFPLEAKSKNGCKLVMSLVSPDLMNFAINAEGFGKGEVVKTTSRSGQETLVSNTTASEDGGFVVIIAPGVVGQTGGEATFEASSSSCTVQINYDWGTAMKRVIR
jgi:hypothetical protein